MDLKVIPKTNGLHNLESVHHCCLAVYSTLSKETNLWLEPLLLPLFINVEGGRERERQVEGRVPGSGVRRSGF